MQDSSDLTVIYLTADRIPDSFASYVRSTLEEACFGYPIISVSRKPIDFGTNLIDTDPPGYANIYRQILRSAKLAETPYIAVAEDDTLYSREHFTFFRPKDDEVAYNMSKWSLYSWDPVFSLKRRKTNAAMIAPRLYLIEALQERFDRFAGDPPDRISGEVGRNNIERALGVTERRAVEVYSTVPIIQISHPQGTEERQKTMRKRVGEIRATEIPFWGRADTIAKRYA